MPNPPGANPSVAERAPCRSSQSCVTRGQQPIGNPYRFLSHFFCTPGKPLCDPNSHSWGRLFQSVPRRGGRSKGGRKQMRANANKRRQMLTNASKRRGENASKREQTWTNANKRLHPPLLRFFTPPFAIPLFSYRGVSTRGLGTSQYPTNTYTFLSFFFFNLQM